MSLRSRLNALERKAAKVQPAIQDAGEPQVSLTESIRNLADEYAADPGKFARDYDAFWAEQGHEPLMSAAEVSEACRRAANRELHGDPEDDGDDGEAQA